MCAILINLQPGDEIIAPSYSFVSTANAFVLHGANVVFADSEKNTPNISAEDIKKLITPKTKAIVVVHYAGIACDMDAIIDIARENNLYVIEDAAQAIDSYYKDRPLGSIGHLAAFSFHETKNIISGEGGLLVINEDSLMDRAEIIWEKGTNRNAFFRGEVDKYGWVDIGSSYLPSDIIAAFLFAQLEKLDDIQSKRKSIWDLYYSNLKELEKTELIKLPVIPDYATNNAHMFYLICKSNDTRNRLIDYLDNFGIKAVFHYLSLHSSPFYHERHNGRSLPMCDLYMDCLVRLPLFYELKKDEIQFVCDKIKEFVWQRSKIEEL
jgi:dTDP-4-amino-4,6-dideoxygalactose transaminase